jgi:L-rhamnose mutarotase
LSTSLSTRACGPASKPRFPAPIFANYTIFIRDDFLFGYYEYVGDDHAADLESIAADPETQRWWALTDPCQEQLPGTPDGSQWAPLAELWHLD